MLKHKWIESLEDERRMWMHEHTPDDQEYLEMVDSDFRRHPYANFCDSPLFEVYLPFLFGRVLQ